MACVTVVIQLCCNLASGGHELRSRTCLLVEQPCPTDHAAQQVLLLHGLSLVS
jgi:hypothetical protein